jgi:hypothetical protein
MVGASLGAPPLTERPERIALRIRIPLLDVAIGSKATKSVKPTTSSRALSATFSDNEAATAELMVTISRAEVPV